MSRAIDTNRQVKLGPVSGNIGATEFIGKDVAALARSDSVLRQEEEFRCSRNIQVASVAVMVALFG